MLWQDVFYNFSIVRSLDVSRDIDEVGIAVSAPDMFSLEKFVSNPNENTQSLTDPPNELGSVKCKSNQGFVGIVVEVDTSNQIELPSNALRVDNANQDADLDLVERGRKLWDRENHTYTINKEKDWKW